MSLLYGRDAIDVAKMSGVQLHRGSTQPGDIPDTSWETAEAFIAKGVPAEDFYLSYNMSKGDAAEIILCLVAMLKAVMDYGQRS